MNKFFLLKKLRWFFLVVIIFSIDLGSKFFIIHHFMLGDMISLCKSLNLHYIRNYGIAFSLFSYDIGWQHWLIISVITILCFFLLILMYCIPVTNNIINIAYALITGGALGNLFDRIWHGFVIDMIDFCVNNYHFAVFNLADSFICIGVVLIILDYLLK